jgi:hypothetical protein
MPARLYVYDTILQGLAQDPDDVAAELRPFIQKKDAVVRQRHVARQRHLAPADQPDIRDGVMRGTTRMGRDQGGAVAGAAGDAVEVRGLDGLGQVMLGRIMATRRANMDLHTPDKLTIKSVC